MCGLKENRVPPCVKHAGTGGMKWGDRKREREESGAANKHRHSSVTPLLLLYEAFFSYPSLELSLYLSQTAHSHINALSHHQLYPPGFQ